MASGLGRVERTLQALDSAIDSVDEARQAYTSAREAYTKLRSGDLAGAMASVGQAAMAGVGAVSGAKAGSKLLGHHAPCQGKRIFPWNENQLGCFGAGTPVLTPSGSKAIEEFQIGDVVLCRDEFDDGGEVRVRVIEEIFVRHAMTMTVTIGGRAIITTAQHPIWIVGKGWQEAGTLTAGDRLLGHDGQTYPIEGIATGDWVTVYNFRVRDDHTYFVGCVEWGFDVWVHNAYIDEAIKNNSKLLTKKGKVRYIDPETNRQKTTDRSQLDGDHRLSKKVFENQVKEAEALMERKLTIPEKGLVNALMNSPENLVPMPISHNRAKGSRSADEYAKTPVGVKASKKYVADLKNTQASIQTQLDDLLQSFHR
ncbi:MAG: polymorphic toxin-type HINT domain-containing protein [Gemmataceae bacterium]